MRLWQLLLMDEVSALGAYIIGSPAVTESGTGVSNSSTTMTLNLPSDIDAGEALVIVVSTAAGRTVTPPSGFTVARAVNAGGSGTQRQICIMTKPADGSEGSTVTASQSSASSYSAVAVRIKDWTEIEVSTGATGSSTSPNPDAVAPSWGGSVTSLVLAVIGSRGGRSTAEPSGYSGLTTGESSNVSVAIAHKTETTASADPGAFTTPSSEAWSAATVVIR